MEKCLMSRSDPIPLLTASYKLLEMRKLKSILRDLYILKLMKREYMIVIEIEVLDNSTYLVITSLHTDTEKEGYLFKIPLKCSKLKNLTDLKSMQNIERVMMSHNLRNLLLLNGDIIALDYLSSSNSENVLEEIDNMIDAIIDIADTLDSKIINYIEMESIMIQLKCGIDNRKTFLVVIGLIIILWIPVALIDYYLLILAPLMILMYYYLGKYKAIKRNTKVLNSKQ